MGRGRHGTAVRSARRMTAAGAGGSIIKAWQNAKGLQASETDALDEMNGARLSIFMIDTCALFGSGQGRVFCY